MPCDLAQAGTLVLFLGISVDLQEEDRLCRWKSKMGAKEMGLDIPNTEQGAAVR